ncbi:hypothetical protein KXD40_008831 [Peronospora effusa]|uniref:Uncharacterized protein n=1 Tax=Peronospora effusa TaxID=542832 RepID=A0A3M6VSY0_9STRA|nr:hypothetical protein DD238_005006 [Peronospora effusa]UIZ21941.1 hypothetical protein KXD40_008831 [Peronospora effusa]
MHQQLVLWLSCVSMKKHSDASAFALETSSADQLQDKRHPLASKRAEHERCSDWAAATLTSDELRHADHNGFNINLLKLSWSSTAVDPMGENECLIRV